ncbi:hypothetical protein FB45DRAFT_1037406 [Roridomyces roridus]|uniref:Uncharacterized protein n=1 Tax=Roridomyces roridus TaxID=1738132 RepID=A0AAD7B624_9AGAR|nr:hypothetical protein FB45DRAFT_1037406 [Roridomyces roridus]
MTSTPTFPQDVERLINETLLDDSRVMCSSMALVASRFYAWTKQLRGRTVVVRRRDGYDWMQRITEYLLPNASLARTLAINLPFTSEGPMPETELAYIRNLLQASRGVVSLAVTWNIWARLSSECGSLPLGNLYLIWDGWGGGLRIPRAEPSLVNLLHPDTLLELTIYSPPDLQNPTPFRSIANFYVPDIAPCANLKYVSYAVDRPPTPNICLLCKERPSLRTRFVLVMPEAWVSDRALSDMLVEMNKEWYPTFSNTWLPSFDHVLAEWLKKAEGRESVLDHPEPHEV